MKRYRALCKSKDIDRNNLELTCQKLLQSVIKVCLYTIIIFNHCFIKIQNHIYSYNDHLKVYNKKSKNIF